MIGAARASVQTTIAAFILCCAAMPSTAAEQAVSNKDVAKYLRSEGPRPRQAVGCCLGRIGKSGACPGHVSLHPGQDR